MKHRNYSVTDIESWKFQSIEMPDVWKDHLGELVQNFRMIIEGQPGHGKTEYLLQLTKMLAKTYGKVNLNNVEQGRSASLKEAVMRNRISELNQDTKTRGKWILADKSQHTFDAWFKRLERPNSGRIIALDSIDYMKLTIEQFKQIHQRFPHKAIILVCWNDPMDINSKKIRYMCDCKVEVKNYVAKIRSRFGGNRDYVIWDKPHTGQIKMFAT